VIRAEKAAGNERHRIQPARTKIDPAGTSAPATATRAASSKGELKREEDRLTSDPPVNNGSPSGGDEKNYQKY